jgi:hypothetical protein
MSPSSHLLVLIVRTILLVTALERSLSLAFQPLSTTTTTTTITTPASQSTTTTKQRTIQRSLVDKASKKLLEFGTNTSSYPHGILVVDGNNVRGIAKFQWSPVELSTRIAQLCHTYNISNHVIVWDHGRTRFAALNAANSVTLFSGLSHRADDVLTQEARHLVELFQRRRRVDGTDKDRFVWGPEQLCFVTNDGELQSRLRRVHDREEETNGRTTIRTRRSVAAASMEVVSTTSLRTGPLILDSTSFVELLSAMDATADSWSEDKNQSYLSSRTNSVLRLAMDQAHESLKKFAQLQKTRYNPRREKTWERCILAEWLQRAYCQGEPFLQTTATRTLTALNNSTPPQQADREPEAKGTCTELDAPSSFGILYLQNLESRGFVTPSSTVSAARPLSLQEETTSTISHSNNPKAAEDDTYSNIPGPLRLDKREKRLLQKYNGALRKGLLK